MDCDHVQREEIIEKYVLRVLSANDEEAFEVHFLECPRCREECELHLALKTALDAGVVAERANWLYRTAWWQWAAAASVAGVLVAGGYFLWPRQATDSLPSPSPAPVEAAPGPPAPAPPQPAETVSVAELARIEPPKYTPMVLRGTESDARRRFRQAMKSYAAGDYATVATGLEQAAKLDPGDPAIRFFLGACYLLTDRDGAGITELRRTVALGPTPFLEEARFYLAKAYLRIGDTGAARAELGAVIQLEGPLAEDARKLLGELERIRGSPP